MVTAEEHAYVVVWSYVVGAPNGFAWAWFCRCGCGENGFESARDALRDCSEHIPSGVPR